METPLKGDVVVVPFPFSDLSINKKRPALVLSVLKGDDIILCQITSRHTKDSYAITLRENELKAGTLMQESNIRPNKLFTADRSIIIYKVASLKIEKLQQVVQKAREIIKDQ